MALFVDPVALVTVALIESVGVVEESTLVLGSMPRLADTDRPRSIDDKPPTVRLALTLMLGMRGAAEDGKVIAIVEFTRGKPTLALIGPILPITELLGVPIAALNL